MADKISNEVIDLNSEEAKGGGGGGRVHVPEGDYPAKVVSVKFQNSSSGNPMFVWEIMGTSGRLNKKKLKEYTVLKANSYWKLRDLIESCGLKVPGALPVRKLLEWCKKNVIGSEIGITLEDDDYTNDKGKTTTSSKISDYIAIADLSGEAPEDDDDVEDDDIEEEEDEDTKDELAGLSRPELKALIKEKGLDITVKKAMSDDDIRAAIRELDGDEEEEEEEDEEEDEDDGLDEMDRAELKAHIKSNKLDIPVKKSMDDDAIRAAIRAAGGDDEEEIEDVDLDDL